MQKFQNAEDQRQKAQLTISTTADNKRYSLLNGSSALNTLLHKVGTTCIPETKKCIIKKIIVHISVFKLVEIFFCFIKQQQQL